MTEKTIEAMIFKILKYWREKLIYLTYIDFIAPPVFFFLFRKIFINIKKFCQYNSIICFLSWIKKKMKLEKKMV